MQVKTTPTTCNRCLRRVTPVLALDGCDLDVDALEDDDETEIHLCRECLEDMLAFIGQEPE